MSILQVRLPLEISVLSMGLTIYDYLEIDSGLRTKIRRCSAAHFRSQCTPSPTSTKPTPPPKSETVDAFPLLLLKEGPPWDEFFQTFHDNKSKGQLHNTHNSG